LKIQPNVKLRSDQWIGLLLRMILGFVASFARFLVVSLNKVGRLGFDTTGLHQCSRFSTSME
jgi:hypothetical protein